MTSSWFFLSTLNYDARSTTHQIYCTEAAGKCQTSRTTVPIAVFCSSLISLSLSEIIYEERCEHDGYSREVRRLEGVVVGSVGPWALLWRHCAARWHTAARGRAVRFVIRPSVCSKAAALLQNKKVFGTEWVLQSGREVVTFRSSSLSVEKCRITQIHDCVQHHDRMKENETGGTCDSCGWRDT